MTWAGVRSCVGGTASPGFEIVGIPSRTQKLSFSLRDDTQRGYGGEQILYRGKGKIAAGTFRHTAPCPAERATLYEWTIEALDASGKTIASGNIVGPFPTQ
jgi:hypothetical protein